MGKLEIQQKWSVNGVIVTVYEEQSSTVGSRPQQIRTTTSKPTTRSCGYDRRAELLAYAHHLRNVDTQQIHPDHHIPADSKPPYKPKKRGRWFGRLKSLKFSFGRLFGRQKNKAWNYENVESRGHESCRYRSCPSPHQGRARCSKISKRLCSVLKQFSSGCKCSNGFDKNDEQLQDLHNTN